MLDDTTVAAYLHRIGISDRKLPTRSWLDELMSAHLRTVPFENLDIHLRRPISLELDDLIAKIVDRRRGGFCYELNGAFAALLRSLGYQVHLLEGRVFGESGQPGIRFDHATLLVDLEGPLLVDVGFGAFTEAPVDLVLDREQHDVNGRTVLQAAADGWIDVLLDGAPQYRFSLEPHSLSDFEPGCRFHQGPSSPFARGPLCSLQTATGRVTLRGSRLIVTTRSSLHGEPDRFELDLDDARVEHELADRFGIELSEADLAML